MGLFFGDGNVFSKSGNNTFISGKDTDMMVNSGNMTFSQNGSSMLSANIGNGMSFTNKAKTISQSGNSFFCDGKTYLRSGDMLFGPEGKTWNGKMGDDDVKNIIFNDNN